MNKRRGAAAECEPDLDALDFAPAILRAQGQSPSPLPRSILHILLALAGIMLIWATFGRLDIVAVAQGKLVPASFVKIVQPAEPGIVREILVGEGEAVAAGQVLMRMDARIAEADRRIIENDLELRALQLRRIDAELSGVAPGRKAGDTPTLFAEMQAQYRARRQAYIDTLENERAVLAKSRADLKAALEVGAKLERTAPIYREQAESWNRLAREGFAGRLLALERQRAHIEVEQDLRAQTHAVDSLRALVLQSEKRIAQIDSGYRQQLQTERLEAASQYLKLQQERDKQQHRHGLLELKAPQAGVVKDLATHTPGTVVAPGTILLTLVPQNEPLQAEVWVSNIDAGFVRPQQPVKMKLQAYPFQQYGTLDGIVRQISADATDGRDHAGGNNGARGEFLQYRALIDLKSAHVERNGQSFRPLPGMQVDAEIHLGTRGIWAYLLSPMQRVAQEAGRER